jgi:uncharacterized membrane protein YdbT with pleckstrin-like domain
MRVVLFLCRRYWLMILASALTVVNAFLDRSWPWIFAGIVTPVVCVLAARLDFRELLYKAQDKAAK